MEREANSPETQAAIDNFKATFEHFDPDGVCYPGSNLVVGDQLEIDTSWRGEVLGGETGLVWFIVPAWGNDAIMPIDLIGYITDRIGPNGETLPVFDEPEQQAARGAASTQAGAAPVQKHGHTRSLKDALKDAMKRLPHDKQQQVREAMKKAGALKDDDKH